MKVFIILSLCVVASFAAPAGFGSDEKKDKEIKLVKYDLSTDNKGNYKLDVDGSDGTKSSEQGALKDLKTPEGPFETKSGSISYVGGDGKVYTLTYFADETGYHAEGQHLPVAPASPEEILKSLALPRDHNPDGPKE